MKIHRHITSGLLAAVLALAGSASQTQAQTIITNTFTFTFGTGGATSPFNSTWIYWYNSPGGNTPILCDPTTGTNNPTPGANTSGNGSLEVISPLAGGTQNIFFGTFASKINNAYDFSIEANTLLYSSVSFDILVAPNTPLSANTNYGNIQVGFINSGYSYEQITTGSVTIPASASSNWYHISVPIDQTQGFGSVPGIALTLNSYGGYPEFTMTNWIANISINGATAPPPGPPSMTPPQDAIIGLNLIDTTASAGGDRYQIADTNDSSGGLSFVGQSSVTYSWTIKTFPTNDPAYSYQAHFFIVSGPDGTNSTTIYPGPYDQSADYNLANCIFVAMRSDGKGGGLMDFRYKTNEPGNSPTGGNSMIFNTMSPTNPANTNLWPVMPVCSLDDSNGIFGTWSVNFANTTNVTMTGPGGATTNFVFDAASAALFADPATIILGAQPNSSGFTGLQDVVYSSFSLAGTPAAFTDNFLADPSLKTNIWEILANDPAGVVLVPAGSLYWIGWTLPAPNYSLVESTSLASADWTSVASVPIIKDGTTMQALISSSDLLGATQDYFAVVQRTFSQLQVLLPGQTNAPNAASGVIGTPTPFSIGASGGLLTVTVLAVDAEWNPIPGVTDKIQISNNGGGINPNSAALVNGQGQFTMLFNGQASDVIVTATDTTNTNIPPASSTPFTVGP
jgi:hypothetical protein